VPIDAALDSPNAALRARRPFLLPPAHAGAGIIEEIALPVAVEYRQGSSTRYKIAVTIFQ